MQKAQAGALKSARSLRFGRTEQPSVLLTALMLASLVFAVPAQAQVTGGATSADKDPRRTRPGANVTKETNPEDRTTKTDDERVHDSYQPKGIDLGQYLLLPKLEIDEFYNTNLYATRDNRRSDFVTVVRPEVKLRSRFKEHALNVSLMAERFRHNRQHKEDRLDLQAEIDGRYDFSSETQANVFQQFFSRHEDRGSPDDAGGTEPAATRGFVNRTNVKHQFGRFTTIGEVGIDRRLFDNVPTSLGTVIPNRDRDRWELLSRGRLAYELFPGYAAVTEISANQRRYDQDRDRNGYDRNSWGYRAEAGIGVDISNLIRGDFLVGYFAQDYRDQRLRDPRSVSVRAVFNWTPSTLTIVVPSLERTVTETTTSGSSALVRTGASLNVRHELERNIVLSSYTSVFYDEQIGVSGNNAWSYEVRLRGTYAFTPEFFVGGEVAERIKRSQAASSSFNQSIVMMRLGLQL